MKVLLIVHTLGIQILDTQKWITGNVLVYQMEDSHLANAIAWCHRQSESYAACGLKEVPKEGYTTSQWKQILLAELRRREEIAEKAERQALEALREKLELKTKSVRQIKAEASLLLQKGDKTSLLAASKLLENID